MNSELKTKQCSFCGAQNSRNRAFFSGRPRARLEGKPTPFACADCVQEASLTKQATSPSALCTFCGIIGQTKLSQDDIRMCAGCVAFCDGLAVDHSLRD